MAMSTVFAFPHATTSVPDPQCVSHTAERSNRTVEMITIITGITGVLVAILTLAFMGYKYWEKSRRNVNLVWLLCMPMPYALLYNLIIAQPPLPTTSTTTNGRRSAPTDNRCKWFSLVFNPQVPFIYTKPQPPPKAPSSAFKAYIRDRVETPRRPRGARDLEHAQPLNYYGDLYDVRKYVLRNIIPDFKRLIVLTNRSRLKQFDQSEHLSFVFIFFFFLESTFTSRRSIYIMRAFFYSRLL